MNDLCVESYDAKEVADKKQSMSKRMTVAGSAIVLTLGLFSLVGCDDNYIERGEEKTSQVEEQDYLVEPYEILPTPTPTPFAPAPLTLGGSGSWFVSVLEIVA